jgi:hypothetical protein
MPKRADRPDIEIGASFEAKKLRFDRVPDREVRHLGDWSSTSERTNLPDRVEPGVTYHDIEVGWHTEARTAETEHFKEELPNSRGERKKT